MFVWIRGNECQIQRDQIQTMCTNICKDSIREISRVTVLVKTQLIPFSNVLTRVWSLRKKSTDILKTCSTVNQILPQAFQERTMIFKSLSTVSLLLDYDLNNYIPLTFSVRVLSHQKRRPKLLLVTICR